MLRKYFDIIRARANFKADFRFGGDTKLFISQ